ncbi:MAG: transposase family protein, partial [Planctomycetes bacterium]|nr:transposase family protein [Planctomycetota bacterium]
MDTNPLFTAALGLIPPWCVVRSDFRPEQRLLEMQVDFKSGARFACPDCGGKDCAVHDTVEKRWRHMDFFQHQAFIVARVPRVQCPGCGVRLITVPWARANSGFTLLMEGLILEMSRSTPVRNIAKLLRVSDNRVWRVIQ